MHEYLRTMWRLDFGWLAALVAVLEGRRPISALVDGDGEPERLPATHTVAFATNHDSSSTSTVVSTFRPALSRWRTRSR